MEVIFLQLDANVDNTVGFVLIEKKDFRSTVSEYEQ